MPENSDSNKLKRILLHPARACRNGLRAIFSVGNDEVDAQATPSTHGSSVEQNESYRQDPSALIEKNLNTGDPNGTSDSASIGTNGDTSGVTPHTPADAVDTSGVGANGMSVQKGEEIWQAILHEMEDNRIYTDTSVTRDTFAERIGCNHTWFSQVIREKTGKSYPLFMNSWRVEEATRILLDPSVKIGMRELAAQLGFLSASTFFASFKQLKGISPADFRRRNKSQKES